MKILNSHINYPLRHQTVRKIAESNLAGFKAQGELEKRTGIPVLGNHYAANWGVKFGADPGDEYDGTSAEVTDSDVNDLSIAWENEGRPEEGDDDYNPSN